MVDWLRRWAYWDSNQRPRSWWRGFLAVVVGEEEEEEQLAAWARRALRSASVMARRRLGGLGVVRVEVEGRGVGSGCCSGGERGVSMSGLAA